MQKYYPFPQPVCILGVVPHELRVTVITPAYNVAEFIGETIASVKRQTETRFEYIIIDDGSTDGTADVIKSAIAGDERMRLIEIEHAGGSAARNCGIREAKAEFISFIDGDDRWHPKKLAHQLKVIKEVGPEYGAVFSQSFLISEGGMRIGLQRNRKGRHDLDDMLAENCPPRNGSSLLIRASCFDEVGMFDETMISAEDFDLWLRINAHSSTPLFWSDKRFLIDYRLRGNQQSKDINERMLAIETILGTYAPKMTRLPVAAAYIDHAVMAHRTNDKVRIALWSDLARSAGLPVLLRLPVGRTLLFWRGLGTRGGMVYRKLNGKLIDLARITVQRLVAVPS